MSVFFEWAWLVQLLKREFGSECIRADYTWDFSEIRIAYDISYIKGVVFRGKGRGRIALHPGSRVKPTFDTYRKIRRHFKFLQRQIA